jgi:hypothetical protein
MDGNARLAENRAMSTSNTCQLCKGARLGSDGERAMQACFRCARQIGLIPMPPSRRPLRPCARCNGLQFVRVIPREHTSARAGDRNTQISAPMCATYMPRVHRGIFSNSTRELEIETAGVGMFEIHICRKCGAAEWTCLDVERIQAHPHLMTEYVDIEGEGPYR